MGVLNRLTAIGVEKQKTPGAYPDGGGLNLQVVNGKRGIGKSWFWRFTRGGKTRSMGFGAYPAVSLAEARRMRDKWRDVLRHGGDPITERDAPKVSKITFGDCAEAYMAAHAPEWSKAYRRQWRITLEVYARPLWALPAGEVGVEQILEVLAPIWTEKRTTASNVRVRIEAILDLAKVRGHRRGENPARWRGNLRHLLPAAPRGEQPHHAALAYRELPAFMAELRPRGEIVARLLEFIILTAARGGEAAGARWEEFDLESKVWTVPAARMKARRVHRVPLSPAAIAVLEAMPRGLPASRVFRGDRAGMLRMLRRMSHGHITVHGFRSAFRDWCGNETSFPREIAEAAVAHAIGNATELAYRRGDALERRRKLMEAWAEFANRPSNILAFPLGA